jgi:hypothetical protein
MPRLDGVDVRPPSTFPKDQESRIGTLRGTLPGIPRQKLFLDITLKIPPSIAFCRTDNGLKKAKIRGGVMFHGRRVLIPLAIIFLFLFVMTLSGFAQTAGQTSVAPGTTPGQTITPGEPIYPPVNPNPSSSGTTQPAPVPRINPSQPPYTEGSTTTIPKTTNPNPGYPNQPFPYRPSPTEVNPYQSPNLVPNVTPSVPSVPSPVPSPNYRPTR